jgi:deazaflavin-dependent oxidoreductase (nitroreductase family)
MYQDLGGAVAVFASYAGADVNPAWYHNLAADPQVSAEIGSEVRSFRARTAEGEERDRIWAKQKELAPGFADYEAKTSRTIPVVVLDPV